MIDRFSQLVAKIELMEQIDESNVLELFAVAACDKSRFVKKILALTEGEIKELLLNLSAIPKLSLNIELEHLSQTEKKVCAEQIYDALYTASQNIQLFTPARGALNILALNRKYLSVSRPDDKHGAEFDIFRHYHGFYGDNSFIIGDFNKSAVDKTRRALAENSILWLHGPDGVGKTSLVQHFWTEYKSVHPAVKSAYISFEDEPTVLAAHLEDIPNCDLLVLDHVDSVDRSASPFIAKAEKVRHLVLVSRAERPSSLRTFKAKRPILRAKINPPDLNAKREFCNQLLRQYRLPYLPEIVEPIVAKESDFWRIQGKISNIVLNQFGLSNQAVDQNETYVVRTLSELDKNMLETLLLELIDNHNAVTLAKELKSQLLDSSNLEISEESYRRLSRWCHPRLKTGKTKYVKPIAKRISEILFGYVIARKLISDKRILLKAIAKS